jgi:hypothetical protein
MKVERSVPSYRKCSSSTPNDDVGRLAPSGMALPHWRVKARAGHHLFPRATPLCTSSTLVLTHGSHRMACPCRRPLISYMPWLMSYFLRTEELPEKCCVTYYINNNSAGRKIEHPFSYIKSISLQCGAGRGGAGCGNGGGGSHLPFHSFLV